MTFDSKAEMNFYKFLTGRKIKFEFQKRIDLTRNTLKKNKNVLLLSKHGYTQVYLKVDFVFDLHGITYYIDTKGSKDFVDPVSKLKYRLLAFKLFEEGKADTSRIKFIYMDGMESAMYSIIALQQGNKNVDI